MAAIAAINLAASGQHGQMPVIQLRTNIRAFAITEVVLGGLCTVLGITAFALNQSKPWVYHRTFGEGVWGGIGIVIAGSFGIPAAKEDAKTGIINFHLAFSIIASILSFAQFFITIWFFFIFYEAGYKLVYGLICLLSLTAAIMLSMSSGYCCRLTGTCVSNQGMYASQQPVFFQSSTTVQSSNQGYPPVAPEKYPVNPIPQNPPIYENQ